MRCDPPILVTGAGQLACALAAAGGEAVRRIGRPAFDFDRPETLAATVEATAPWLIVNAAAWTGVDAAEDHPDEAARANALGPGALAALAAARGIAMIHLSTDYVFDGSKGAPYVEADPTAPTGVYGATKLAGEAAVLAACPRAIVLRTAWVYSTTGRNFVRAMLARLGQPCLRVVADQRGNPTSADDLAGAILAIAALLRIGWRAEYRGVFHAAGTGETTWHGLAEAVFARAGSPVPEVVPIATADWPTRARRPADSRLDSRHLAITFGWRLPDWRDSLARDVDRLLADLP